MRSPKRRFEVRRNRVRAGIANKSDRMRLSVFKSGRHLYAQIIDDKSAMTIASASTLESALRQSKKSHCNKTMAEKIGSLVAQRAVEKGVTSVVFDKGGYRYHGVIQALADAARKELEF